MPGRTRSNGSSRNRRIPALFSAWTATPVPERLPHGGEHPPEGGQLRRRVLPVLRRRAVRRREMRHPPFHPQSGSRRDPPRRLHGLPREQSEPPHPRVDLDVHREGTPRRFRRAGKVADLSQVEQGRRKAVGVGLRRLRRVDTPQHDDGKTDPPLAQLHPFFHRGHAQHPRPIRLEGARHGKRAVPVGVRLHDAEKADALREQRANRVNVVPEGREADLRHGGPGQAGTSRGSEMSDGESLPHPLRASKGRGTI